MTSASTEAARAAAADLRRRTTAVADLLRAADLRVDELLVADTRAGQRDDIGRLTVDVVLRYVPGFGPSTVTTICRRARVDRGARIESLDSVRRERLAAAVRVYDPSGYRGRGPAPEAP